MAIPTRPAGWPLWSILVALLVLVGLVVGFIYVGRSWEPVHALLRWMGRSRQTQHVQAVATPTTFETSSNGASRPYLPTSDDSWKRENAKLQKILEAQQEQMKKILAELEEAKKRKSDHGEKTEKKPPQRERSKAVYVVNEQKAPTLSSAPLYTLAIWEYIPCVLENVLNSEIPGSFTVKITRPVMDATRQHVLIPQGQRAGATAETANLLFGNERIPTFALSVSLPNGQALELGHAPIMDAAGTNGLTGDVDNHVWRLVWTSIFIGGLRGGQQVLQQELANNGTGAIPAAIAREGSSVTQQRLGRAQDTRPTITAHSGELCNILVTEAKQLPEVK